MSMTTHHPVVLLSLDWLRPGDPRTGLGTSSIAATLRADGAQVEVIDAPVNAPGFDVDRVFERLAAAMRDAGPDVIVGIGAFVWNEPELQALLPRVAGLPHARLVLGGPQVSYAPAGTLERHYPHADCFVRGAGEAAMVALVRGDTRSPGLHLAGTPDLGQRAEPDLTALASPHLGSGTAPGAFVRWETQRGCAYACSFCQHREAGERLKRREIPLARLFAELDAFAAAGVARIAVLDPIFHGRRDRGIPLLDHARALGLRAELSLQCRFELIDDAFLDALHGLDVRLEFGLQTVHDDEAKAVHRPNRMSRVDEVITKLHARGIRFEVSLIYGLPLQTLDRFRGSVAWCLDRRVPTVLAFPLMLLRGTPIDLERSRWGFEEAGERIPIVVASHGFDRAEHREMERIARWLAATAPGHPATLPTELRVSLAGVA